ncbi:MAG: HAD-IA family hydrolase [Roseibium sp.]|uniref:HAD-IA family hydrolase n=1 Tax=Roseibium sp. TaxID=1936156 RepID=UPI0026323684|nr:HAD-IA family hydrolase [Roseibium sp.]MCV0425068.1 HAD-IA family hydrolase [Roseibium sp.]
MCEQVNGFVDKIVGETQIFEQSMSFAKTVEDLGLSRFPIQKKYKKFIFDMDGTLVDSRLAIERIWRMWAAEKNMDIAALLCASQGRRTQDTVRDFALKEMDIEAEVAWLQGKEETDLEGIVSIPGAYEFLTGLKCDDWAIVTSAGRLLASKRLEAAGLPIPKVMISAEEVRFGKPSPEGFLLAAERLGVEPNQCLVFEDAPAGIAAGMAAGCDVIAIAAARGHDFDAGCPVVRDFTELAFENCGMIE